MEDFAKREQALELIKSLDWDDFDWLLAELVDYAESEWLYTITPE